jgi:uncharacterized membrane protein (UPF0127 family)
MRYALFLVLLILTGAGCRQTAALHWPDGEVFYPELARTASKQAQGLSGRSVIGDGMLFCFPTSEVRTFWMLNMLLPIDMIWLAGDTVLGVSEDVPIVEMGSWARRMSPAPATAVLEVGSGVARARGLLAGVTLSGVADACR